MLKTLPVEIQRDFMATLDTSIPPTQNGKYVLTDIKKLGGSNNLRIRVVVQDEDARVLHGIPVGFAFDTAHFMTLSQDFKWTPPHQRMDIVFTEGGYADHIQGSVVKKGQPGGVTVFVLDEEVSSDVVSGMGMLADHTGVKLTFTKITPEVDTLKEALDEVRGDIQLLKNQIEKILARIGE